MLLWFVQIQIHNPPCAEILRVSASLIPRDFMENSVFFKPYLIKPFLSAIYTFYEFIGRSQNPDIYRQPYSCYSLNSCSAHPEVPVWFASLFEIGLIMLIPEQPPAMLAFYGWVPLWSRGTRWYFRASQLWGLTIDVRVTNLPYHNSDMNSPAKLIIPSRQVKSVTRELR